MGKRQELREKRRQQERVQRIGIIVTFVVLAVIVVGGVVLSQQPAQGMVKPILISRPQVNVNATGDPKAPVKVIEYADFQCPYCMNFWRDTEAQIIDTYVKTGKVYLEFHSFGSFLGAESARAAEGAYCAGDQGKFWDMHDSLFTNQGPENANSLADNRIVAIAQVVPGLDMGKFNDCFTSGKYAGKVIQDGDAAQQAGVTSTPTFFINGTKVEGAQPFSTFQKDIDAALATAGKQ